MSGEEFKEPLLSPNERRNKRIQAVRLTRPQPTSTSQVAGAQKAGEPMVSATDITGEKTGLGIGDTGAVAQEGSGLPLRSTPDQTDGGASAQILANIPSTKDEHLLDQTLITSDDEDPWDTHPTPSLASPSPSMMPPPPPRYPPPAPVLPRDIQERFEREAAERKAAEDARRDALLTDVQSAQDRQASSSNVGTQGATFVYQDAVGGMPKETPEDWAAMQAARGATADQLLGRPAKADDLVGTNDPTPFTPQDIPPHDGSFTSVLNKQTSDELWGNPDFEEQSAAFPVTDGDARIISSANNNLFQESDNPLPPVPKVPYPLPQPLDNLSTDDLPSWVGRPVADNPQRDDSWMTEQPNGIGYVDAADRDVVLNKRARAEADPLSNLARAEVIPTGEIRENPFNLKIEGVTVASEEHQTRNEDASFIDTEKGIVFICDGMGGHAAGDVASATASNKLKEILLSYAPLHDEEHAKQVIAYAIQQAHEAVITAGKEPGYKGLGTTAVVGCFIQLPDGKRRLIVGNVGDSRAYLLRDKELSQLTLDDNQTNMVVGIKAGGEVQGEAAARAIQAKLNNTEDPSTLTQEERDLFNQRNVITQSLGHSSATPKFFSVEVAVDDRFAFCSDGPSDNQTDRELEEKMNAHPNPLDAARIIIEDTQTRGKINPENIDARHPEGKPDHPRGKPDDYTFIVAEALAVPEKKRTPEEEVRNGINRMAEQLNTYLQFEPVRKDVQRRMNEAVAEIYAGSRVTEFGTNPETGPYMYAQYVRRGQILPEEFNTFAARPGECEISSDGNLASADVLRFLVLGSGLQRNITDADISPNPETPLQLAKIIKYYLQLENTHPVLTKFIGRHKSSFENFLQKHSR